MVKIRDSHSSPSKHRNVARCLRFVLISTILINVLAGLLAWFFPIDVVTSWAYAWAETDEYKQFEAIGQAEFSCWLVRFAAPAVCVVAFWLLRKLPQSADFVAGSFAGWLWVTGTNSDRLPATRWRTTALRGLFIAWIILALGHDWQGLKDCATNWAYFRFQSGHQVLPNISDSNRDVIRYLREATPPNARIFIASDQKLFFLSYYLLPRRLYHKLHPDSEFVIPQAHQQRRLEAYQLADIDGAIIDRIAPDYLLEYFEHPDLVDRTRLQDDRNWLAYFRKRHRDSKVIPEYLVCLRRIERGSLP